MQISYRPETCHRPRLKTMVRRCQRWGMAEFGNYDATPEAAECRWRFQAGVKAIRRGQHVQSLDRLALTAKIAPLLNAGVLRRPGKKEQQGEGKPKMCRAASGSAVEQQEAFGQLHDPLHPARKALAECS